jgi:hypothetical protein
MAISTGDGIKPRTNAERGKEGLTRIRKGEFYTSVYWEGRRWQEKGHKKS